MTPGVSVIICCYNSETRLPEVLDCLSQQKFTKNINWEVIVVDNASKDNTQKIARETWKGDEKKLKVIYEPEAGLSNARMAGLNAAKYDIISFIDDDNRVALNWVQKVYEIMSEHPSVGICGGYGVPVLDSPAPAWFEKYQAAYAVGKQWDKEGILDHTKLNLYGAGFNIRKKVWDQLIANDFKFMLSGRKGKNITSGEDYELSLAVRLAGYDLYYDPNLQFKHYITKDRLNRKYLKKLFKSFGKASVIVDIYAAELLSIKGIKRYRITNIYLSIIYSVYLMLKSLLKIIYRALSGKEFDASITLNYSFAVLAEKIRLLFKFNKIKKTIYNGLWRKDSPYNT